MVRFLFVGPQSEIKEYKGTSSPCFLFVCRTCGDTLLLVPEVDPVTRTGKRMSELAYERKVEIMQRQGWKKHGKYWYCKRHPAL